MSGEWKVEIGEWRVASGKWRVGEVVSRGGEWRWQHVATELLIPLE